MTTSIKAIAVASAFAFAATVPASADYTILEDSSLPSVIFVEFTDVVPTVISAPNSKDVARDSVSLGDPALPPVEPEVIESNQSAEERIEARIKDLEQAGEPEMPAPTMSEEKPEPVDPALKPIDNSSLEDAAPEPAKDADILKEAELR